MTPASIGARLLGLFLPLETARKFALPGFILAALLALTAAWGAWQAFDWFNDRDAVRDAANAANAEFRERADAATGAADTASETARTEHAEKVRKTEELIDEALEKGCVISDYLASAGADCVRPGAPVPGAAAQRP